MGTRWHELPCAAPDITINQCTKSPRCQSCNAFPRLDELIASVAGFSPLPPIPPDEEPGDDLRLFWPASVPYTRSSRGPSLAGSEASIREGEGEPEVALVHQAGTSPIYAHPLLPNEFRLLHLASRLGDDLDSPVHADLKTYNHDDCPEYETVSYTWGGEEGDSTLCKPVFIGPYWDVLLQTKNCWAMLNLMRPRSGQRVVWVDAICINQSNYTEREDQVTKMCRIYEDSLRVFVFLGDDIVHPVENASYPTRRKLYKLPRDSMDGDSSGPGENGLLTLDNVLKRRYFSRIWAVQELILSRQAMIRIGSTEYWVDHQTSRDITKKDRKWNWGSTAAPWFQYATQRSLTGKDWNGLLEAMRLTWGCQSADPRDKVFGILGLAQADDSMPAIRPNYSISTQHVFTGMFAHCLINLRDTKVLSGASGIHGWGDYPSWVPAWKSPTALPEPVDLSSDVLKRWSLEWKREFVRQIDRGRFEMEEQLIARLGVPNGLGIFAKREKREGYYQKYWLQEDSEDLEARDEWDRNEYSVVQFLPIVVGSEHSDQQQINIDMRGEEHCDNTPGMNTTVGASEERPLHDIASVSAATGTLSIALIHLLYIQYKPTLVSQIEGLRCYRVSSRPPREDLKPSISETSESGELSSATLILEKPKILDGGSYLFFTARTADLDDLIIAGQDHLFILEQGSSPPIFLILRETEYTGKFALVASCEEVLFTHISPINEVVGGIRLRDIRKTWDLPEIFRNIASSANSGAAKKIVREAWQLCNTFLGEPSFEDLVTVSLGCYNDDWDIQPSLLDLYISRMGKYHPQYIYNDNSKLRFSHEVVEMCLDHEDWPAKESLFLPLVRWVNVVFRSWRDKDGTWKDFSKEWPGDTTKDLYVRAEVSELLKGIRSALERLNFLNGLKVDDAEELKTDFSLPASEPPATECIQPWSIPWSIPCLPEKLSHIEKGFEFDGSSYRIGIV